VTYQLDIYWSFRSPFSYLALPRLKAISERSDVTAQMRFVRPIALRDPEFFLKNPPQLIPYLIRDAVREASRLEMNLGLPQPDPVDMNMMSKKVAEKQPLMDKLMNLGLAAQAKGQAMEFALAMSTRIWSGEPNWDRSDEMEKLLKSCDLDFDELETWIKSNRQTIKETISINESEQMKHHWGVPLMVLDGEPFFGQDRIDALVWRMNG